jgi:hypothetical protein
LKNNATYLMHGEARVIHTNGGLVPQHYWRLQIKEGGFL